MKTSFFMRHAGYVRNFEPTIRALIQRGHRVDVVFDRRGNPDPELLERYVQNLANEMPLFTYRRFSKVSKISFRSIIAVQVRSAIDYLRYFDPRYAEAPRLRERASRTVSSGLRRLLNITARYRPLRALMRSMLVGIEAVLPLRDEAIVYLREFRPDVVLLTPLVDVGSAQVEYLRAARMQGIKTCLCVASWDNLTNKGVIKEAPDRVVVWNEAQKAEAIELHGVAPEKVVVTGAHSYDHWFEWQPSCDRASFLEKVGLPTDKPYILYLCSSAFIAKTEPKFVKKWIKAIRKSSAPELKDVGILIRPHPGNVEPWENVEFGKYADVAIYPKRGANPVDIQSRNDYFDSIYYSFAVVGVNTSAQVEASILGKAVYTILDPEFADTQAGTLHFHLLLSVNGGLLNVAKSLPEHAAMLAREWQDRDNKNERSQKFVEAFVRPRGLKTRATDVLVEVIEGLGQAEAAAQTSEPWWMKPARPVLMGLAGCLVLDEAFRQSWRRKQNNTKHAPQ